MTSKKKLKRRIRNLKIQFRFMAEDLVDLEDKINVMTKRDREALLKVRLMSELDSNDTPLLNMINRVMEGET